ncbi:MAG: hypothetical protein Kow00114_12690 [Kiloniellaceae bacterium]
MTRGKGSKAGGKTAKALTAACLLLLAACAGTPEDDGSGRTVDMPQEWDSIDLAEADLTLPLVMPLEIATLGRRVGEGQVFENLYTFHGVKGYVFTSRVAFGSYSDSYAASLASMSDFKAYLEGLALPSGEKIDVRYPKPFTDGRFAAGKSLSRGFVSRQASARPLHHRCFVARTGHQMVDYASIEREADAIDTVIVAVLCGDLPDQQALEQMLVKVRAVEDRAAFRRDLARRTIGTI